MFVFLVCISFVCVQGASDLILTLSGDQCAVLGATFHFTTEIFTSQGKKALGEFKYEWEDRAIPNRVQTIESNLSISHWNITHAYPDPTGQFNVHVQVWKKNNKIYQFFNDKWGLIGAVTLPYNVTRLVNGQLQVLQNNTVRKNYISNSQVVTHMIKPEEVDANYMKESGLSWKSYWFVDCVYYGTSDDLQFRSNYTDLDKVHYSEVLVVGSVPPVIPTTVAPTTTSTTTTAKPNTTTTLPPVTTKATTTTPRTTTASTTTTISGKLANVTNSSTILKNNKTIDALDTSGSDEFSLWLSSFKNNTLENRVSNFCINLTSIPMAKNKTYGYFRTNFTTKAPVKVLPVNGTNWLLDGTVLNMAVGCNGSAPFKYCVALKSGPYNVTGNETCPEEKLTRNCSFELTHLFKEASEYTFIVVISNAVSHVVKPIAVNVYKVAKHPQLSVIIVPVTFSIVAVILITFGVASYIQSRRSYTVEVADFDFGNQASDLEYKTFRERLRESISNSFLRSEEFNDTESVWPPKRRYGSMQ